MTLPSGAIVLKLIGHTPGKKNLWRTGKGGKRYISADVKAQLDSITIQAASQWRRDPVIHPDMSIEFYVRDRVPDRDNKLTALLDCLREAKVIQNDNIADFNGTVVLLPAVMSKEESVVVRIELAPRPNETK